MMHHSFSLLPQFSSSFLPSTRTLCPPNLFSTSTIPCESSSKETGLEQSEKKKNGSYLLDSLHTSRFCSCGRRHFIGFSATSLLPVSSSSNASDSQSNSNVHLLSPLISNLPQNLWAMLNRVHPPKPDWYEEFFALVMEKGMASYEDEVAGYKEKLFSSLRGRKCKDVLELGIGTGPNLKYYAGDVGVHVYGVDPNKKMEKYAAAAALAAGLPSTNFYYTQAVGEALPANDASMDAVVGTLVLCSVKDVKATLKEVKRVLKPGGLYVFMEHVAAEGGTGLRFVQNVADPLQQLLADGCHLTRETGKYIFEAGFSDVNINKISVSSASYISPRVYGTACK